MCSSRKTLVFVIFHLCILIDFGYSDRKKSLEYKTQDFIGNINLKNHFVMFYAPWCSHCQRLHPIWEQLAELLNEEESRVTIAQVDCTNEGNLCAQQDITAYPTLKYFSTDNLEPIKYKGLHELTHLTIFLNVQMGSSLGNGENEEEVVSSTKDLNDENYLAELSIGNHFVKFYAPWCHFCQKLAPTWEELGKSFLDHKHVQINKIDCTVNKDACKSFNIKGYPTLLWIENGQVIEKYQNTNTRDIDSFKEYVNERLDRLNSLEGKNVEESTDEPSSPVMTLTSSNFKTTVSTNALTFIKFFAPWCGHCKNLAPTWEDLGRKFFSNHDVIIAKVDCTLTVNSELCGDQQVNGFPTLFLYKKGKKVEEYTGSRSLEELHEFVVKHLDQHDEL